jgi:secreted trypsin-like serine protease
LSALGYGGGHGPGVLARGAGAIVGGAPDPTRTAVALVADDAQAVACSGVLVAPDVVVTAAHCLVGIAADWRVSFSETPLSDPSSFRAVREIDADPAYDATTLAHDVGVLLLAKPAPVAPDPWLASDPGGVYQVGTSFVASGFGLTSPSDQGALERRSVAIGIDAVDASTFTHDQTDGLGGCTGDSGGPALADVRGVETVIGVFRYSDQSCSSYSNWTRTDAESSFLLQYAPEPRGDALGAMSLAALLLLAWRRA